MCVHDTRTWLLDQLPSGIEGKEEEEYILQKEKKLCNYSLLMPTDEQPRNTDQMVAILHIAFLKDNI